MGRGWASQFSRSNLLAIFFLRRSKFLWSYFFIRMVSFCELCFFVENDYTRINMALLEFFYLFAYKIMIVLGLMPINLQKINPNNLKKICPFNFSFNSWSINCPNERKNVNCNFTPFSGIKLNPVFFGFSFNLKRIT